jgi:hypothetical protein
MRPAGLIRLDIVRRELYRVFVDETGDRGWGSKSSDIFVLSAIIVRDSDVPRLQVALDHINNTLGKPSGTTLHWAENIKTHEQRKFVARTLGTIPMTITNVIVMKRHIDSSTTRLNDATSMYNYAVRRPVERLSFCMQRNGGEAVVTFAHVRRFPYQKLHDYLARLQAGDTQIKWQLFTGRPRIDQPSRVAGLQVADLVAGCLWAALHADRYGGYETAYLREIYRKLFIGKNRDITSYGMNVIGRPGCMDGYPWWPRFVLACKKNSAG